MIWIVRPPAHVLAATHDVELLNRAHLFAWSLEPATRLTRTLLRCLATRRGIARAA